MSPDEQDACRYRTGALTGVSVGRQGAQPSARANRTKLKRTIDLVRRLDELNAYWLPHNRQAWSHLPCADFGHHNTDYMRAMLLLANKTRSVRTVRSGWLFSWRTVTATASIKA